MIAGCSSSPPTAVPAFEPTLSVSASATSRPSPSPTRTPSPLPPTPQPASPSPSPSPTSVSQQCSLLTGYSLDEFPEIVSSPFILPRPGKDDGHHGVDFAHYLYGDKTTIAGAPVQAFLGGEVAGAISDSWPYGNFVLIETSYDRIPPVFLGRFPVPATFSLYHLYAHLENPPALVAGDAVACGDVIGEVGNSGASGNYHLHFEIRFGPPGQRFSSMAYYQTTTTEEERRLYEFWRMDPTFILVDPMELLLLTP